MANEWINHVKEVKKENKELKLSEVLKLASKTWDKENKKKK